MVSNEKVVERLQKVQMLIQHYEQIIDTLEQERRELINYLDLNKKSSENELKW